MTNPLFDYFEYDPYEFEYETDLYPLDDPDYYDPDEDYGDPPEFDDEYLYEEQSFDELVSGEDDDLLEGNPT